MYSKPSQRKTAETLSTKSRASAPGCPLRSGASEATELFTKRMVTNEKRPVHKLSGAEHMEEACTTNRARCRMCLSRRHPSVINLACCW